MSLCFGVNVSSADRYFALFLENRVLLQMYNQTFGIEGCHKRMEGDLARTSTKNRECSGACTITAIKVSRRQVAE